jgi:hypothetical protein
MQLKTEIWVSAFLRRHAAQGRYGAVLRKGSAEAGTLFIIVNHLDGTCDLLGPPPGPSYDEQGERRFQKEFNAPVSFADIEQLLQRRRKADPDMWEVEIEDKNGLADLLPEII